MGSRGSHGHGRQSLPATPTVLWGLQMASWSWPGWPSGTCLRPGLGWLHANTWSLHCCRQEPCTIRAGQPHASTWTFSALPCWVPCHHSWESCHVLDPLLPLLGISLHARFLPTATQSLAMCWGPHCMLGTLSLQSGPSLQHLGCLAGPWRSILPAYWSAPVGALPAVCLASPTPQHAGCLAHR